MVLVLLRTVVQVLVVSFTVSNGSPSCTSTSGFLGYAIIDRPEEIIVHLLFLKIYPGLEIEPAEGSEPGVRVGDVDEFYRILR